MLSYDQSILFILNVSSKLYDIFLELLMAIVKNKNSKN